MIMPSALKSSAMAALALGTLLAAPVAAQDCWVPTRDTSEARHRGTLPGMRAAVDAAVEMVRDNPHFKAMPRPIRIRATVDVGPGYGRVNVKAYQPAVWEGTCGLVAGADRCCSDGNVTVLAAFLR